MWLGAIWGIAVAGLLPFSLISQCFLGPAQPTNNASELRADGLEDGGWEDSHPNTQSHTSAQAASTCCSPIKGGDTHYLHPFLVDQLFSFSVVTNLQLLTRTHHTRVSCNRRHFFKGELRWSGVFGRATLASCGGTEESPTRPLVPGRRPLGWGRSLRSQSGTPRPHVNKEMHQMWCII